MDVEMKIGGMSEGNMMDEMKDAVSGMNGVHHMEIKLEDGMIKVDYDQEEVSLKEICRTIEGLGYTIDG